MNFLYANQDKTLLTISTKTIEQMYLCAREFGIEKLCKFYEMIFFSKIEQQKYALRILEIVYRLKLNDFSIYQNLLKIVCKNLNECLKSTHFLKLDAQVLIGLLHRINEQRENLTEDTVLLVLKKTLLWLNLNHKSNDDHFGLDDSALFNLLSSCSGFKKRSSTKEHDLICLYEHLKLPTTLQLIKKF